MRKILIFGNSGSGKSTLAKKLCKSGKLAHLDLDVLAWQLSTPPKRKPLKESAQEIEKFINSHSSWVIEGCYTDLLEIAAPQSNEAIFMNLTLDACIANANNRPWEPHKYNSKELQDSNLGMLTEWIAQYKERDDTFSATSHFDFFDKYSGSKKMVTRNEPHT